MRQIVEEWPISQYLEKSFAKFLDPNPKPDDLTSAVKFLQRFVQ